MRYFLTLILLLACTSLWAQRKKSRGYQDPFLKTQWYLGFYGGGNLAGINPTTAYFGYAPLNYPQTEIAKRYNNYANIGGQYGLVFMFYTEGFTIGLKPGINIYNTEYSTTISWQETANTANSLKINYQHNTQFNYLEFPLTVQYDLLRERLRPYIGLGGYYGVLLNAARTIQRSGVDAASGSAGGFNNQPQTIGVQDEYIKSLVGVMGFIGASYDPGNIRITLDLGYKFGLNNIANTANRFVNNPLAAIGEATDDQQLRNFYLSLGFVFPLKFISKNYNSVN